RSSSGTRNAARLTNTAPWPGRLIRMRIMSSRSLSPCQSWKKSSWNSDSTTEPTCISAHNIMPTMIQSVVRPEKVHEIMKALFDAGFPAVTKMDVFGRGKQRGIKIGEITYDELPKEQLLVVVPDGDKDLVVETILKSARTGTKGAFGDGKIFISKVDESWTVSSSSKDDCP